MKTAFKKMYCFFSSFSEDKLRIHSAQATFFIILSFVPFFILLLTFMRFTPLKEDTITEFINDYSPARLKAFLNSIVDEIYNKTSATVISVTAVMAVWSASSAFAAIAEGLNNIFHVHETRNYLIIRVLSIFYTFLLIVFIALYFAMVVFGNQLINLLNNLTPWLYGILTTILKFKVLYAITLLTLLFMFIFKYIPNRKSSLMKELPGALFSALGWLGFSYVYSLYVDKSVNFSALYGGLATLAFAMLWLYMCMYIFFIGAEISKFINK